MSRLSRIAKALLVITAVTHLGFFGAAYGALTLAGARFPGAGAALATLVGYSGIVAVVRKGLDDRKSPAWRARFLRIPYFVHWCACVFTLLPDLLYVVLRPLGGLAVGDARVPPSGFLVIYAVGLVVCAYGVLVRRRVFQELHVEVRVRDLPPAFEGFTIAHLSDLHIGALTPEDWGHRWVRAANAFAADVAVVTGDMVTSGTAFHEDIARVVSALRARDGVFVSMGNHDYFGEGEPLVSLLAAGGSRVLRNEGVVLTRGDARLYLAAIDDTWTRRADLDLALAERPAGVPCVLLAHDPEMFPKAAARGVDVTLSGHTHGGQIAVPFLAERFSLATLAHTFNLGVYRDGDATLYVHPGLGTTGPPIRLGAAPAVVKLTLRAAA
ncbi:MAG TPA: metallophosphoesterase [Polyangiaceae bacterium]|nr:metallophosphoesterase [Polyangiaceae bacterium]